MEYHYEYNKHNGRYYIMWKDEYDNIYGGYESYGDESIADQVCQELQSMDSKAND